MVSNTISTAANFVGSWCGVCRGAGVQGMQGMQGVQGMQGMQGMQGVQGVQGVRGVQGVQELDSVYVSKQPLLEFHFRYSQIVS